ncbi:MAG: endonuclease [Ferruginibacter sp.]
MRVHFLLFGSYLINEKKDRPIRLGLTFNDGELNLYACAIRILEGDINNLYDWTADVMNPTWDERTAIKKLKQGKDKFICDALLNQEIFAGVGNIIKNEVLYRIKIHPESAVNKLQPAKIRQIVKEVRIYSFEFLEWKKNFVLKKHWLAHAKKMCTRCKLPLVKKYTGTGLRRSFFCTNCQKLYY